MNQKLNTAEDKFKLTGTDQNKDDHSDSDPGEISRDAPDETLDGMV